MKKQYNLGKISFTLIETLISLIIISILISGFSKFINNNSNYNIYQDLQKAQNEFIKNGTITTVFKDFTLKNH